jgi:hypothetical protein
VGSKGEPTVWSATSCRFEVPSAEALAGLPVEVLHHAEPWVVTIRSTAADGTTVDLTWDQVAASIALGIRREEVEIVRMERECVVCVRASASDEAVHFEIEMSVDGVGGVLGVDVGSSVLLRDTLLRR